MSKIQGKQVADGTITQNLLNLGVPTSGDTTSGATVGYVNARMTGGGAVTIGPAEDGEYTDGIFTDFTTGTTIGVAVDRFNEMFKLLAPTPPSGNWTGAFTTMQLNPAPTISARSIGDGVLRSSAVITTGQPAFTVTDSVGTDTNARTKDGTFVFTLKNWDGSVLETTTITTTSVTKSTGLITYTIADPYMGQSGKQGFWTGVTAFNAGGTLTAPQAISPSVTGRTLSFEHPTSTTRTTTTFYVDNAIHTPVATSLVVGTVPTMTNYVSGVPTLAAGQSFTNVGFSITNVSSYFYASPNVWNIAGTRVSSVSGDVDSVPQTVGATGTVSNKTATVTAGYQDGGTWFTVTPYNRSSVAGTTTSYTNSTIRIDTISTETQRYISGSGLYPTVGSAYNSTESAKYLTTTNPYELQLIGGNYKWPAGNWTTYGGPDYSSVTTGDNIGGTEWRWATFSLGSKGTPVNNITITVPGSIGSTWNAIKMYVKIGASGWVDATVAQAVQDPYNNGDYALDVAGSTAYNVRKITFGTIPRSGAVYVRIGIKSTDTSFTFSLPTMA